MVKSHVQLRAEWVAFMRFPHWWIRIRIIKYHQPFHRGDSESILRSSGKSGKIRPSKNPHNKEMTQCPNANPPAWASSTFRTSIKVFKDGHLFACHKSFRRWGPRCKTQGLGSFLVLKNQLLCQKDKMWWLEQKLPKKEVKKSKWSGE